MSLGIAFKGPEGIVLGADSRVTLNAQAANVQTPNQIMVVPATYDNATKLLKIEGQDYVAVVTYGAGAIGQQVPRTPHSFIPEFEKELSNAKRLPVEEFARKFSDFFLRQWKVAMPPIYVGPDMVFLVGGYDEGAPYGRVFEIDIPSSPTPRELFSEEGAGGFGMVWGGQREYVDRLIQGFDEGVLGVAQRFLKIDDKKRDTLREQLRANLNVPVPYPFLPLQDCVDLTIFLIRTTMTLQTWIVGIRGVGGAIDVATITRAEGFQPVQLKRVVGERL